MLRKDKNQTDLISDDDLEASSIDEESDEDNDDLESPSNEKDDDSNTATSDSKDDSTSTSERDRHSEEPSNDRVEEAKSETNYREAELKSLTSDRDIKSLILDFLYNETEINAKKEQFYRILKALPLLKRIDFISKIPKNLLESIHSGLNEFIETMLALPIDEHISFFYKFSEEHIKKVFLVKSTEETLQSLDIRKHTTAPLPSATLYHTERNLLFFLTRAYRSTVMDKFSLDSRAHDLEHLIQANGDIDTFFIIDSVENATLLLIFKRFQLLFKERYQQFKATPDQIHIVLDLDDTLATNTEEETINRSEMKWFIDNKLIIQALAPHIIHPGAIELIQFLFSIPNIRVSFFSRGIEERNILLVNAILARALGVEGFTKVKDSITVFSRYDLSAGFRNPMKISDCLRAGNQLKNLARITNPNQLDNTILIEDDLSYCHPGQERNMLIHKFVRHWVFQSKFDRCDDIHEANHVFYIAGVLKWIFTNKGNQSLADTLFQFQFTENTDKKEDSYPFKELFWRKQETNRYFREGLALLQTFNPKLDFCGGEKARLLLHTDLNPNDYNKIEYNESRRKKKASSDGFSKAPQPVKLRLFSFLSSPSIAAMRSVCKKWNYHCHTLPYKVKSPGNSA